LWHACEDWSEHFVGAEEMVNVGAGVFFTYSTVAFFINRSKVSLKFGAVNIYFAVVGKQRTVAAIFGGKHTIESVDTTGNADKHILRLADTEQMTWLFGR